MDKPQSAQPPEGEQAPPTPEITSVTSDGPSSRIAPDRTPEAAMPARTTRLPVIVSIISLLLGMAALAASAWNYTDSQREVLRLSTELAELRVSLDLYARNGAGGDTDLADLTERLDSLEQDWRGNAVPMPEAAAPSPAPQAAASGEDCLPAGMRLLVAAGDSYPICAQSSEVSVSAVENGFITLADGTSVASGGTTPLAGSACMLSVTSNGDEGLTGYAEIRVSC